MIEALAILAIAAAVLFVARRRTSALEARLAELQAGRTAELLAQRDREARALEILRERHAQELHAAREQHTAALSALRDEHGLASSGLREEHAIAVAGLREEHAGAQLSLREDHARALAEERDQRSRELAEERDRGTNVLSGERERSRAQLTTAQAELEGERQRSLALLAAERERHRLATDALEARRAQELDEQRAFLREQEARLQDLHAKLTAAEAARAEVQAQLAAASEQQALIDAAQLKIETTIELSAKRAFDTNSAHLLQLVQQSQESSKVELDKRAQAVEHLVKPVQESLRLVDEKLGKLEKSGEVSAAQLGEQMRTVASNNERLREETARLATALRAPGTRGKWGETQLRRTLELAGLRAHVDFDEQPVACAPDGVLRPDVAVRLPGGKTVLLDSKAPLEAFQRAVDAAPEDRLALLQTHAAQLRAHVDALSRKQYWEAFEGSPEMTVLFLPADGLLSAALEADPTLHEDAFARRIVLATPATLLALLLTIAHVWKQESLAENARAIAAEGRELHKRIAKLSEHLRKHGNALHSAVQSYNAFVGSFEQRLVPAAAELQRLDAASPDVELTVQLEITEAPRAPRLLEAALVDDAN